MGCISMDKLDQILESASIRDMKDELDTSALQDVYGHYEDLESHISNLIEAYRDYPGYVNGIVSALNDVADADIIGMGSLIEDLYSGSSTKAIGAEFGMAYLRQYKDEVAEMEVPMARTRKDGTRFSSPGFDVMKKDGSIDELKSYGRVSPSNAKDHIDQAIGRVEKGMCEDVTLVYDRSENPDYPRGKMSDRTRQTLDEAARNNPHFNWKFVDSSP